MESALKRGASVSITLDPHHQSLDSLHKLVANIAGRAGCLGCGRLAYLRIDLVGDPEPDLAKLGVVSVISGGAAH